MTMIVHSSFALFLILILFIHTLNAINPAYFRQPHHEQQLASLSEGISKQLDDQQSNYDSSENNDEDDQLVKRNKYTNFHLSPLWLSRRTRGSRLFGKPLWVSRTG